MQPGRAGAGAGRRSPRPTPTRAEAGHPTDTGARARGGGVGAGPADVGPRGPVRGAGRDAHPAAGQRGRVRADAAPPRGRRRRATRGGTVVGRGHERLRRDPPDHRERVPRRRRAARGRHGRVDHRSTTRSSPVTVAEVTDSAAAPTDPGAGEEGEEAGRDADGADGRPPDGRLHARRPHAGAGRRAAGHQRARPGPGQLDRGRGARRAARRADRRTGRRVPGRARRRGREGQPLVTVDHRARRRRVRRDHRLADARSSAGDLVVVGRRRHRATETTADAEARTSDRRSTCSTPPEQRRAAPPAVLELRGAARAVPRRPAGGRAAPGRPRGASRASTCRSSARPARASPRCCTCSACSTGRPSGEYLLDGVPTATAPASATARRCAAGHIGFVFQAFHLLPHRTVLDNVLLATLYSGVPRSGAAGPRAGRARPRRPQPPASTSCPRCCRAASGSGWPSRARSSPQPHVLLADEPTGNLDSENSASVLDLFDELHADGLTLVVITHDDDGLGARAAPGPDRRRLPAGDRVTAAVAPSERVARSDRFGLRDLLAEAAAGIGARPGRLLLTILGTVLGIALGGRDRRAGADRGGADQQAVRRGRRDAGRGRAGDQQRLGRLRARDRARSRGTPRTAPSGSRASRPPARSPRWTSATRRSPRSR